MGIKKVSFKEVVNRDIIEHHYAAFITQSNEIILHGPFLNSNHVRKIATDIMNKKEKSRSFFIIPYLVAWETGTLDKNLVNLAKANQLADCVILENTYPDSVDEMKQFAINFFSKE